VANVVFVCRQNAGRSQMSEALFLRAADGHHSARSAGTTPATHADPEVVAVMHEVGIDLNDRVPQRLTTELASWADLVVTMGCGDECPYIPASAKSTGTCPTRRAEPLLRSAPSATTSSAA